MTARSSCPRRVAGVSALLFDRPSVIALVVASGVPILIGVWLLMSPGNVLSRHGIVDLLFNLAGAWRIHEGQIPHVDFHTALGPLPFLLTLAGFRLVGPGPQAFLAGELIALAVIFVAAVAAVRPRMPLAAAIVFVLVVALPVIMPINTGGQVHVFTFAMSYNRYGWSAISILSLIVFVPPRDAAKSVTSDLVTAAVLLLAMFYIKITYFCVGLAALGLALLVSDHVRARWLAWTSLGALAVGNAVAPHSHVYLADLWGGVVAGMPNLGLGIHLRAVADNAPEYALFGIGLIVAAWLRYRGLVPLRVPAATAFLIAAATLLIAQNTQTYGLPLGVVIAFLLYEALLRRAPDRRATDAVPLLAVLMLYPLLSAGHAAASLVAYRRAATDPAMFRFVDQTALRGLAVAVETPPQNDFVGAVVEAASLFADGRKPGRIQTLERINPLPFALGLASPRGDDLFWEFGAPLRPPEAFFADADYVMVPKEPTSVVTEKALARYGDYLAIHFPIREESPRWILLSR
jgi:hypothetical protein